MIIDLELATEVWKIVKKDTTLKSMINGGIYNGNRPFDSKLQDITVNSLLVPNTPLQFSTVIINAFIPDVKIGETFYKDGNKIIAISKRIIELFTSQSNPQYGVFLDNDYKVYFEIESQQTYISQEQENWHVLSFRLKTRTINI